VTRALVATAARGLFEIYRAWPLAHLGGTALGAICCWLVWPVSAALALVALALPHALPLSLLAHELGHLLAALAAGRTLKDTRLVAGGGRLYVEADSGRGDRWIAAAGPLGAGLVGAVLAACALALNQVAGVLALPFLAHLAGLLPHTGDGRRIWNPDRQVTPS
jgi:Peptidase M50B-like